MAPTLSSSADRGRKLGLVRKVVEVGREDVDVRNDFVHQRTTAGRDLVCRKKEWLQTKTISVGVTLKAM